MTTSQFFVYKRPVAWTALVATLLWGYFAYRAMPQRHDPIIPIRIATVVTIYPGRRRGKGRAEVTRKIEKQVAPVRQGGKGLFAEPAELSVVFVELFESVKNPEQVWQDLQGRLESMTDLPRWPAGRSARKSTRISARRVALMLTDLQPQGLGLRDPPAGRKASATRSGDFRRGRPPQYRRDRLTAVLVYPNTVGRSYVLWLGQSLLQRLAEQGLIEDGHVVGPPAPAVSISNWQGKDRRRVDPRMRSVGNATRSAPACRTPTCGRALSSATSPRWKRKLALEPARPGGRARSLQLSRTAPLRRHDPRPPEAVSHDRQDRRDRRAGRGHLPVLQQPPLQRLRPFAADALPARLSAATSICPAAAWRRRSKR